MKYNGIKLEQITEPQLFDPPKEMLVWDSGSHEPRIELVWGIAPASAKSEFPIHCVGGSCYDNCAKIPQQKPKRATHLQLAEWLAKGNGMWKRENEHSATINVSFFEDLQYEEVEDFVLIRPFGATEWLEPTLENMGMEEQ